MAERARPACPDCGGAKADAAVRCRRCADQRKKRRTLERILSPEDAAAAAAQPVLTMPCEWRLCPLRDDPERARTIVEANEMVRAQALGLRFYHSPVKDGAGAPDCYRAAKRDRLRVTPLRELGARREVTCAGCGVRFVRTRSQLAPGGRSYHSHECYLEARRRHEKWVTLTCRLCGAGRTVRPSWAAKIRTLDPVTGAYTCRRCCQTPRPVWADAPCGTCGQRFRVPGWRRATARFCSPSHRGEWQRRQVLVTFDCGHRRFRPERRVRAGQRFCSHACFVAVTRPTPPAEARALGPQAKHERAVARYRAAVDGGATSLRRIAEAAGLSLTTAQKLRRELEGRRDADAIDTPGGTAVQ